MAGILDAHWEGFDKLQVQFDHMVESLSDAKKEVPEAVVEWQREDMHRKYPNVVVNETDTGTTVTTMVWPRSRRVRSKEEMRRVYIARARNRRFGPKQYYGPGGRPVRGHHPILRQELLDKFNERIPKEVLEPVKWLST